MLFINPCMISLALISASIAVNVTVFTLNKSNELINSFTTEGQKQMYYIVRKERMYIHTLAYTISIALALLYAFALNSRKKPINYCFFSLIIHAVAIIIYKCYPRTYSLKSYLVTQDQKDNFSKLKLQMKNSYVVGLSIGVIIYMLSDSQCKNN